jgi:hypothetical protein
MATATDSALTAKFSTDRQEGPATAGPSCYKVLRGLIVLDELSRNATGEVLSGLNLAIANTL